MKDMNAMWGESVEHLKWKQGSTVSFKGKIDSYSEKTRYSVFDVSANTLASWRAILSIKRLVFVLKEWVWHLRSFGMLRSVDC